jgi:hypothetical protein
MVERFSLETDLEFLADGWLLAEAGEPLDSPPADPGEIYRLLAPGFVPIAFTNPVHIRVSPGDGD